MGLIKLEDVVAWIDSEGKIYCTKCGDDINHDPLTQDDFEETDVVICDNIKAHNEKQYCII